MIWFAIGLIVGGTLGIFMMAIFTAGRDKEKFIEESDSKII